MPELGRGRDGSGLWHKKNRKPESYPPPCNTRISFQQGAQSIFFLHLNKKLISQNNNFAKKYHRTPFRKPELGPVPVYSAIHENIHISQIFTELVNIFTEDVLAGTRTVAKASQ